MTVYHLLVTLHVLCVIGGFGALAYNPLYLSLSRRRPAGGAAAVVEVNGLVSGLAELLVYAALLFGVGAVGESHSTVSFSDPWVAGAFGVYFAAIGVLHGWIKPQGRRFGQTARQLEAGSGGDGALLQRLEKRVALGWGTFNLLVVAAVCLMVFKPGG